jgi:hypothetical protein
MSAHDYHDALPGFSEDQIWHDGCGECEDRSEHVGRSISQLDSQNFARAWERAAKWNKTGLADVSKAEAPLLNVLWSLQLQLERRGVPIGSLPLPAGVEA